MASVFRLPHTQFHAGFVCNFLSSSAGLNLCSCFLRLTLFHLSVSFGPMFPRPGVASAPLSSSAVFRPLSRPSVLGSDYSASVSSVPSSSRSCLTLRFRCSVPLSVSRLFPSVRLISHAPFRLSVLGPLFVSFRPLQFRSHSCSTGVRSAFAFLFSVSRSLSFVRSLSFPGYSALCSSVPSSSQFRLTVASPVLSFPLGPPSFPFRPSDLSSVFPVIGTWPSVCFLSSFPASLPQPFHR